MEGKMIYKTFESVRYYHPDAHMIRLCHSLHEAEDYIKGWGVSPTGFCFPIWTMPDAKLFIVFASERKNRK